MTQDTAHTEQQDFLESGQQPDKKSYRPLIFDYQDESLHLILKKSNPAFYDEIEAQVKGLIKVRNPQLTSDSQALSQLYQEWLSQNNLVEYGVYVFYPWSNRMVHLLPEAEFIELRTARNRHKITSAEQKQLQNKCVGVIGLSVGQSVALTMAVERSCGCLKLADFDELELSNLNRIKTGVHHLGLPKTIITAREIAEIDPFLPFEIYSKGITPQNIDGFLDNSPKVDLLIEECDDLQLKIESRKAARSRGLPVLMDTSDRGMLDVERFDLEPSRELLHGLVPQLDQLNIEDLAPQQKIGVLLQLVGGLNISNRLKASLLELNQSIGSWPQLSSSVTLGSGITGDVARKILLGKPVESGRFYADPELIVPTKKVAQLTRYPAPPSLEREEMARCMSVLEHKKNYVPDYHIIKNAVQMAGLAPSSGNDQPWLFYYRDGCLGVFHNPQRAFSFGDHNNYASYQSIGAAIENLNIFMASKHLGCKVEYQTLESCRALMALITFEKSPQENMEASNLSLAIPKRITNREVVPRIPIASNTIAALNQSIAQFDDIGLQWITDDAALAKVGEVIAECDKLRVFDQWGHQDFFEREMRWTAEETEEKADGIDVRGLGIETENMVGLQILRDYEVVSTLSSIGGGSSFDDIALNATRSASAMGLMTAPNLKGEALINAGRAWERLWLTATNLEISFHPLISPLYLFNRLHNNGSKVLSDNAIAKLNVLWPEFVAIWQLNRLEPVFMFRIFKSEKPPMPSKRLPVEKIFFTDDQQD